MSQWAFLLSTNTTNRNVMRGIRNALPGAHLVELDDEAKVLRRCGGPLGVNRRHASPRQHGVQVVLPEHSQTNARAADSKDTDHNIKMASAACKPSATPTPTNTNKHTGHYCHYCMAPIEAGLGSLVKNSAAFLRKSDRLPILFFGSARVELILVVRTVSLLLQFVQGVLHR